MEEITTPSDKNKDKKGLVTTPVSDEIEKTLKYFYEEKYLDESPQAMNSLVAPENSGTKILDVLGFERKNGRYPEFQDKYVTDIWWWLSSLVFELSPTAKEVIVVDPTFWYDVKALLEREVVRAKKRLTKFDALDNNVSEDMLLLRQENYKNTKEVTDGLEKWEKYAPEDYENIKINSSFAQHIKDIKDDSQDYVFFNFVLDKLEGRQGKQKEIELALINAYRIAKTGGKIYGMQGKTNSDEHILNALGNLGFKSNVRNDGWYLCFEIDKE